MGPLKDGVERLFPRQTWRVYQFLEHVFGIDTWTGRSTRLKSAYGGVVNMPMIFPQWMNRERGRRDVKDWGLQYACSDATDKDGIWRVRAKGRRMSIVAITEGKVWNPGIETCEKYISTVKSCQRDTKSWNAAEWPSEVSLSALVNSSMRSRVGFSSLHAFWLCV